MKIDIYEDKVANELDRVIKENEAILELDRLKTLISTCKGETWDDKVVRFAELNGRSRSSIYRWLTVGPPDNVLDAIAYRMLSYNLHDA